MSNAPRQSMNSEREIFLRAIELSDPNEREAFLTEACGDDATLKASVKSLLSNHKEDDFMKTAEVKMPTQNPPETERRNREVLGEGIGDRIGVYKLLQKIGEGGVGIVYLAEQEKPVHRRVAIKVLKPGLETKSVIARFESESQALAMMDHPNIARVLDAGTTEFGRPFFVMDLVRGMRITEYCDKNQVPTRERLTLFLQVCHAVQHAHQKGIIHRDIKPSNILVTLHDGKPVPKIIDFGIAKAMERRLTEKTMVTEFHSFIGTPAYVSPEQAEMSGLDIDTRADIFSLGVLLYELLTGQTPFDPKDLIACGLDGMRRTIRESEPMRPSTKVKTMLDADRTTTASRQRLEPSKLMSLLQGDLDWIILKALEKDRARRYATANALAMDIHRYLENQPVLARPPNMAYRIQKYVRRNKVTSTAVAAFSGALAIGLGFTTWQWMEKSEAYEQVAISERVEKRLRHQANEARQIAESQALVARQRAYAADMNLAQQALSLNNLGRARELLGRYFPDEQYNTGEIVKPDLRGWEWRYLWQHCRSDALFNLCRVASGVAALSVSSDGRWVAVGEYPSGGISVWDLRSRKELARFNQTYFHQPFQFSPTAPLLAFSSGGSAFASENEPPRNVIRIWDGELRQIVAELPLASRCAAMAFAEDGSRLVTVTEDLEVLFWDVDQAVNLNSRRLEGDFIPRGRFGLGPCALSQDLRIFAHAMGGGRIRVLSISSGEELWQATAAEERVMELALSPDGSTLASSGGFVESSIRLWDVLTGVEMAQIDGHRTYVQSLEFWPDDPILASASGDQTIQLWEVGRMDELRGAVRTFASEGNHWRPLTISQPVSTLRGHQDEVWSLAMSPDKRTLISGGKDGLVSVWDTTSQPADYESITLPVGVRNWSFAPNSQSILAWDDHGRLERWHGDRFQEHHSLLKFDTNVVQVVFSRTTNLVAANRSHTVTEVYHLDQRTPQQTMGSVDHPEVPVAFIGPSGRLVTYQRNTGRFRKWNLETGDVMEAWSLPVSKGKYSAFFSPSGNWSLHLDGEGGGYLRNAKSGKETKLDFGLSQIDQAAFSSNDRFLAIVSWLGTAQVWEVEAGRKAAVLRGFLQGQHSVAFSPQVDRMAIGSNARQAVKLWDVESFSELLTLAGKGSLFRSVAFSPDGNVLASCNGNGRLHIWQAPELEDIARTGEL